MGDIDSPEREETSCPRCGHLQAPADECAACGVIFAKLLPATGDTLYRRASPRSATAGERLSPTVAAARPSAGTWLVPLLLLATAGFFLLRALEPKEETEPVSGLELPREALDRLTASAPETTPAEATTAAAIQGAEASAPEPPLPPRDVERWYQGASGFQAAVNEAMRHRTPMAVYVYTDWCPYCDQMENDLLATVEVRQYLQKLVKVRINPEYGLAERGVADSFGVTGYPSFFVYSPVTGSSEWIGRTVPDGDDRRSATPEEFVASCRVAAGV